MSMLEDVADGLAKRTLQLMRRTGDEKIEQKVLEGIGTSSPTLEEAFATAMRIRKAEARANDIMDKYETGVPVPVAEKRA